MSDILNPVRIMFRRIIFILLSNRSFPIKDFESFKFHDFILAFEKFSMIISGKFNGKIIFQEWADGTKPFGKRSDMKKLIKKYKNQTITEKDWIELFCL